MGFDKKVNRTSAGLRDTLFDAIERLNAGDIDAGQGAAIAKLAREICNSVHLEIEVAKLRTEFPADTPLTLPTPLQLGATQEAVSATPKLRKVEP